MATVVVTPEQIEAAVRAVLVAGGAGEANAASVARVLAVAEAVGNTSCGLYYAPVFFEQMRLGKVDGRATPQVSRSGAAVLVDAACGFAHPAIEAGLPHLLEAVAEHGIAAAAVRNSYNCLALADHVLPIAAKGLIGICVANAPASVAPPGARTPLVGTNPIAFAAPAPDGGMIVVDQGMSVATKTEIVLRKMHGKPIPVGWAQDSAGQPTTDPAVGLAGSLLASGGQKGANIALLVEILAAALTGSNLSAEASGFSDAAGGPSRVGQFILAIDPNRFSDGFAGAIGRLADSYRLAGVRLPGKKRVLPDRVEVDEALWRRVGSLADAAAEGDAVTEGTT